MTRPTSPPRVQAPPKPLMPQPQAERLDTPGGRTLPVMVGGPADFGE